MISEWRGWHYMHAQLARALAIPNLLRNFRILKMRSAIYKSRRFLLFVFQ